MFDKRRQGGYSIRRSEDVSKIEVGHGAPKEVSGLVILGTGLDNVSTGLEGTPTWAFGRLARHELVVIFADERVSRPTLSQWGKWWCFEVGRRNFSVHVLLTPIPASSNDNKGESLLLFHHKRYEGEANASPR